MTRLRLAMFALAAVAMSVFAFTSLLTPAIAQTAGAGTGAGLTFPAVTGALTGGQFAGSLTITRLSYRPGQLLADGSLVGTVSPVGEPTPPAPAATTAATTVAQPISVTQSFRDAPLMLADPNGGACDILNVDVGPIFLDVPGRQLDLAAAALDLTTAQNAERVRGNLLCAVAGLTESTPAGNQLALLNELLLVVNRSLSGTAR